MYLLYNHFHAKYDLTHDTRYCRSRFSQPREHEGEKGNISKCPLSFWPKFWEMLRSYCCRVCDVGRAVNNLLLQTEVPYY